MTNGILKLLMRREEEELAIRHGWEKNPNDGPNPVQVLVQLLGTEAAR